MRVWGTIHSLLGGDAIRKRWIVRLSVLLVLLAVGQVHAGIVLEYSWTGIVEKYPSASADPWGVGSGKPFEISVYVDQAATDYSGSQVDIATFPVLSAEFSLDGTPGTVTPSPIQFWDQPFFAHDIILVDFGLAFGGVVEPMIACTALPPPTFSFTELLESPPFFGTAMTDLRSISHFGSGNYQIVTPAQTVVTSRVIPEPSTLAIWSLLGALSITVGWWRRRRKA